MGIEGAASIRARRVAPCKPNGQALGFQGTHPRLGPPASLHCYRDTDGKPLFFVAYYQSGQSGAQLHTCPWTWNGEGWHTIPWSAPRPLYGLELVTNIPDWPVLILSNERQADCARNLNPHTLCLALSGAISDFDLAPLEGRRVRIWPRNNALGQAWGAALARELEAELLDTTTLPHDSDFQDFVASGNKAREVARFIREYSHKVTEPTEGSPEPQGTVFAAAPTDPPSAFPIAAPARLSLPQFPSEHHVYDYFGLILGTGGRPWVNVDNAVRILEAHPEFQGSDGRPCFWLDEFRGTPMMGKRAVTQADVIDLLLKFQRELCFHKMDKSTLYDAIASVAARHKRHPVKEALERLAPWDGIKRLESFFVDMYGAPRCDYSEAVGSSFLISLIARIYEPGCFAKSMVILEGGQDIGKSTSLHILANPWYYECTERLDTKEFYHGIQGSWIIELPELAGLMRADIEAVKACVSRRDDQYRAPYAHNSEHHPRQCVFVGSTNRRDWQVDETGGCRFLPIRVAQVEFDALRSQRDALLSEALERYRSGVSHTDVPKELSREEQELRHVSDPWLETIESSLAGRSPVTMQECWLYLNIEVENRRQNDANRISRILHTLGYVRSKMKIDGKSVRCYVLRYDLKV